MIDEPLKVLGKNTTTEVGNFYLVGRESDNNVPLAYVAQYDHALLFAAAPDLLAALEQMTDGYQDARRALYPSSDGNCPGIERSRALVAKAKGIKE